MADTPVLSTAEPTDLWSPDVIHLKPSHMVCPRCSQKKKMSVNKNGKNLKYNLILASSARVGRPGEQGLLAGGHPGRRSFSRGFCLLRMFC